MQTYEALSLCAGTLKELHELGIKTSDYKYLKLYEDYVRLLSDGNKTTYAVAVLSERYGICERKVYKVIKRLGQICQKRAVQ